MPLLSDLIEVEVKRKRQFFVAQAIHAFCCLTRLFEEPNSSRVEMVLILDRFKCDVLSDHCISSCVS